MKKINVILSSLLLIGVLANSNIFGGAGGFKARRRFPKKITVQEYADFLPIKLTIQKYLDFTDYDCFKALRNLCKTSKGMRKLVFYSLEEQYASKKVITKDIFDAIKNKNLNDIIKFKKQINEKNSDGQTSIEYTFERVDTNDPFGYIKNTILQLLILLGVGVEVLEEAPKGCRIEPNQINIFTKQREHKVGLGNLDSRLGGTSTVYKGKPKHVIYLP